MQGLTGGEEVEEEVEEEKNEEEEEWHLSSSESFLVSIFFLDLRPNSSTPQVKKNTTPN